MPQSILQPPFILILVPRSLFLLYLHGLGDHNIEAILTSHMPKLYIFIESIIGSVVKLIEVDADPEDLCYRIQNCIFLLVACSDVSRVCWLVPILQSSSTQRADPDTQGCPFETEPLVHRPPTNFARYEVASW